MLGTIYVSDLLSSQVAAALDSSQDIEILGALESDLCVSDVLVRIPGTTYL
jgi:hypothetical protein